MSILWFLMNFEESPKSIKKTRFLLNELGFPIKKFYGLISLCMYPLEWMNSIVSSIYIDSIRIVFKLNFLLHYMNLSSSDSPSNSIIIILYWPSLVPKYILGIPCSCDYGSHYKLKYILVSFSNYYLLYALLYSSFIAYYSPVTMFTDSYILPY